MTTAKTNIVANAWADYRRSVIPVGAPPVQLKESKRAFYAGAEMLILAIMNGLSAGPDSSPEDEGMLEAIHTELLAFARDVKEGRA